MDESSLDKHCESIFTFLLLSEKPLRFVELHNEINLKSFRMSRPTLIEHLEHLQARKIIVRKKVGPQKVTYEPNWQRLGRFQPGPKTYQMITRTIENEKRFKSFPIDEQVTYATNILTLTSLFQLKLAVQDILDPKNSLEHSLEYLVSSKAFGFYKTFLMQSCQESTENGQKALEILQQNIQHFISILFDREPSSPTNPKIDRTVL